MPKGVVLVIDDEADLIELVRYNLEKEGYRVLGAADGESGCARAVDEKPDAIVVDLMLPGMDGLEVCRMLRASNATSGTPILILTAKASESDRVVGLEIGADDYLTKPFSPRELAARIRALLRRSAGYTRQPATLRFGNLTIDPAGHSVHCGNRAVELTATESAAAVPGRAPGIRLFARRADRRGPRPRRHGAGPHRRRAHHVVAEKARAVRRVRRNGSRFRLQIPRIIPE